MFPLPIISWQVAHRDRRTEEEVATNMKLSITFSFFEIQTPDVAWEFIWTV